MIHLLIILNLKENWIFSLKRHQNLNKSRFNNCQLFEKVMKSDEQFQGKSERWRILNGFFKKKRAKGDKVSSSHFLWNLINSIFKTSWSNKLDIKYNLFENGSMLILTRSSPFESNVVYKNIGVKFNTLRSDNKLFAKFCAKIEINAKLNDW